MGFVTESGQVLYGTTDLQVETRGRGVTRLQFPAYAVDRPYVVLVTPQFESPVGVMVVREPDGVYITTSDEDGPIPAPYTVVIYDLADTR